MSILKQLDHPNIINYYEIFNDDNNVHIVMEYCAGGDLIDSVLKNSSINERDIA